MNINPLHNPILGSLVTGLLLAIGTSVPVLGWLTIFSLVPILVSFSEARMGGRFVLMTYLGMFVWINGMNADMILQDYDQRSATIVSGMLILPLIWSFPWLICKWMERWIGSNAAILLLPLAWVSLEVLQYYWSLSFTWLGLGYAFAEFPFLRGSYAFWGIEGLSFWVVALNVLIYRLWLAKKNDRSLIKPSVLLIFLVLLPVFFSFIAEDPKSDDRMRVAVFQPSLEEQEALDDDLEAQVAFLAKQMKETDLTGVDLLVCPEGYLVERSNAPLFTNSLAKHPAIRSLAVLTDYYDLSIITGASFVQLYSARTPPTLSSKQQGENVFYDVYNGSVLVTAAGDVAWRAKQALVPISEETPLYRIANTLEELGLFPWRFDRTYGSTDFFGPYALDIGKVAPLVCFEAQFPTVMQAYEQAGSDAHVLLSTQWSSSDQTLRRQQRYAQAMASAFSCSFLLASNKGSSALVNRTEVIALENEDTIQIVDLSKYRKSSFYSKNIKPSYWFFVSILTMLVSFLQKRWIRSGAK
jgi:apolipoprotein N-acyltransferase